MNRQIIMQPKSIVGGNITVNGPQTATAVAVTENTDEVQYFPRTTKKLAAQGANNALPTNLAETVNVVFRAPVVSSSSNQSMRPPPPPPPKIKGHSEEPSSSIPDLGEFVFFFFPYFYIECDSHNPKQSKANRNRHVREISGSVRVFPLNLHFVSCFFPYILI